MNAFKQFLKATWPALLFGTVFGTAAGMLAWFLLNEAFK